MPDSTTLDFPTVEIVAFESVDLGYGTVFFMKIFDETFSSESQSAFSLKLNGRFQFRYTYFDSDVSNEQTNDF